MPRLPKRLIAIFVFLILSLALSVLGSLSFCHFSQRAVFAPDDEFVHEGNLRSVFYNNQVIDFHYPPLGYYILTLGRTYLPTTKNVCWPNSLATLLLVISVVASFHRFWLNEAHNDSQLSEQQLEAGSYGPLSYLGASMAGAALLVSPLLTASMRVIYIDLLMTAGVALTWWLLLKTNNFRNYFWAGVAGTALAASMLCKFADAIFLSVPVALALLGYLSPIADKENSKLARRWLGIAIFITAWLAILGPYFCFYPHAWQPISDACLPIWRFYDNYAVSLNCVLQCLGLWSWGAAGVLLSLVLAGLGLASRWHSRRSFRPYFVLALAFFLPFFELVRMCYHHAQYSLPLLIPWSMFLALAMNDLLLFCQVPHTVNRDEIPLEDNSYISVANSGSESSGRRLLSRTRNPKLIVWLLALYLLFSIGLINLYPLVSAGEIVVPQNSIPAARLEEGSCIIAPLAGVDFWPRFTHSPLGTPVWK